MSPKPQRTSHDIALYLQRAGYEIVPVNPGHDAILGLTCFPRLASVAGAVDIVDVFRAAEHEDEVAADILAMPSLPRAAWFQLNAGGDGVAEMLREKGIAVFVNSCIKVVHSICRSQS